MQMEFFFHDIDYYELQLMYNWLTEHLPAGFVVHSIDQDAKTDLVYIKIFYVLDGVDIERTYVFEITAERTLRLACENDVL